MTEISICIPIKAYELMVILTPNQVYRRLLESGSIPTLELLTFAMVITPIHRFRSVHPVGHVAYWGDNRVTVTAEKGGASTLMGSEFSPSLSPDEAIALFEKHWQLQ